MYKAGIENFLAQGLDFMGLHLPNQPEALSRLSLYFQELKKWNSKVNLVARSLDDRQILAKHFLDSLTLLSLLPPEEQEQETILDVGTGAGFPGLAMKAACPALSVTLIEPRKNRYYFLKHIARSLNLKGLEVLEVRLEDKKEVPVLAGRRFSMITSRAFTDITRFVKLAAPYLIKNGRIVLMKGPGVAAELDDLHRKGRNDKFSVAATQRVILPHAFGERWLVTIKGQGAKL